MLATLNRASRVQLPFPLLARKGGTLKTVYTERRKGMIKAAVNKGEVSCRIEGRGIQILSEITLLVDSILDAMVKDGDMDKKELVNLVCSGLNHIN